MMKVDIPEGKYILAVSGGVDSVALLDILTNQDNLEIVVAHFDHGIRISSSEDKAFVQAAASKYGLVFEYAEGELGPAASEDTSRTARYQFLREMKQKHEAAAIVTAHHQDDLIETALINILRGTGPKGLVAICSNKEVLRPLLTYSKKDILSYARLHKLEWMDDPTNQDNNYLRNYLRNVTLKNLGKPERANLLEQIRKIETVSSETESIIAKISHKLLTDDITLKRSAFISLPTEVGNSFLVYWLNKLEAGSLDRKTVLRLSNALKTAQPGSSHDINKGSQLLMTKKEGTFRR